MCQTSEVFDHYLFGYRYIVIDLLVNFDLSLASNPLVRWIGVVNTIVNDILCVQIFDFLCVLGSLNIKLIVGDIKVIPCRMNIWISSVVNRANMDIEFAIGQKGSYFILS